MSENLDEHIDEMLKTAGLYHTENRVLILKMLFKAGKPLSQEKIARQAGTNNLDKVTIYRTLESLFNAGLVHKAFLNKRASHYELAHRCTKKQCHPHFTCTKCGSTHCLVDLALPMPVSYHKGFIINHQQVHLEGLCPACS
ncbi:MAG: transcriptional repressor [Sedimentisphaerales bacterium]|nr:transcriptional repressor [Sedimentisphaerales bacterium]